MENKKCAILNGQRMKNRASSITGRTKDGLHRGIPSPGRLTCCAWRCVLFLDHAQSENDLLRREDAGPEAFEDDRLEVNPPVHPFEDGEIAEIESFFQDVETRGAAVVGPVPQFPSFIKLQPALGEVLVIIKRPDAERDAVVGFAVVLGAQEKRHAHLDFAPWPRDAVEFGHHRVKILKMLEDVRAEDEIEMIVRKRPWIFVEVGDLVAAVIDDIQIGPAGANIGSAADVEPSTFVRRSRWVNGRFVRCHLCARLDLLPSARQTGLPAGNQGDGVSY